MQERLERVQEVPSLYVRVYQCEAAEYTSMTCSLTVCEGVSGSSSYGLTELQFPHYM